MLQFQTALAAQARAKGAALREQFED
jgi:hypothetical protein